MPRGKSAASQVRAADLAQAERTRDAVYKALRVRLFKTPPEDFDARKATDRQLLVHGFPPRPDPEANPRLRELWDEVASRPMTAVEPQFALRTDRRHGPAVADVSNATSSNWSGSVVSVGGGDTFTFVIGQWTVPAVVPAGSGNFYCSEWVGIDGWGSGDVLQAGTETEIVSGVHSTYAWWEWYPDYEVAITNFPVTPGDVMYCAICVLSTTQATIYLTNMTSGSSTSFTITAPPKVTLVGNSAEWVVETPTVNGVVAKLPKYGLVYFDSCMANAKNTGIRSGGQGTPVTMVDAAGKQISVPEIESDEMIEVRRYDPGL